MSLYQWAACIDGINEQNEGDTVDAPKNSRLRRPRMVMFNGL
jgi:hypothetical protein